MKKVYILFVACLILSVLLTSTSSSTGQSRKECATCHGGITDKEEGNLFLRNLPENYIPGVSYHLDLCLVDTRKVAAGFQLTASEGIFKIPSSEEMAEASQNEAFHTGRTLLENDTACWNVMWMAPAFVPDKVDFVARGTAVDADFTEKGDHGGYYTVQSSGVLSVNFGPFYSKSENKKVHLIWSSIQELDNEYFTLEKSQDGNHWKTIHTEKGKQKSFSLQKYRYIDNNPSKGVSFYRLSQTNKSGKKYSHPEILKVFISVNQSVFKSQYQVGDKLVLNSNLSLFDLAGNQLHYAEEGELLIPDLEEGVYFLRSPSYLRKILITK